MTKRTKNRIIKKITGGPKVKQKSTKSAKPTPKPTPKSHTYVLKADAKDRELYHSMRIQYLTQEPLNEKNDG